MTCMIFQWCAITGVLLGIGYFLYVLFYIIRGKNPYINYKEDDKR